MTISLNQDPNSPPWNPKPDSFTSCVKESSGVQFNFFKELYPQFCNSMNSKKDSALSKTLTNKDFPSPKLKRWIGSLYPELPHQVLINTRIFNSSLIGPEAVASALM